jgi:hypothetical protein
MWLSPYRASVATRRYPDQHNICGLWPRSRSRRSTLGAQLDALARSLTQLLERWSRRVVVVPVTEKISIPSIQWL